MANPIQRNPDFFSGIKSYESCLGKGAFGVVLKALDTSDSPTAIKFIFLDGYSDSERKTLLREGVPTKLEQHPNVIKVINAQVKTFSATEIEEIFKDISSLNDLKAQCIAKANRGFNNYLETFCIQMELCGQNLLEWLNEKHNANDLHIQIRQTRIVQGMISGVKYLHNNNSQKIIHRDLKPENIMFSKGRYQLPVKIGDFGLCRRIHSADSESGSMTNGVGTRTYMAPEVHRGEYYDHQADLYSLGLIIWEVSQLIGTKNIRHLFDELVNGQAEELVKDHPIMTGIKKIIIGLTKRKTTDRTKTLNDMHIDSWDQQLLHEILNQNCKAIWDAISSSEMILTAKSSLELKLCLDNAQPGCIINLTDGEYLGPFVLNEDDLQIIGSGTGTVLRSNDSAFFTISGSGCTISNAKIIGFGSGVTIQGSNNRTKFSNCQFEERVLLRD